jgi:hypothetical protein
VDKKFDHLAIFWAVLGRPREDGTDVWTKKVGFWSKIFKKWAAKSRWGSKTFSICGQKPKNF